VLVVGGWFPEAMKMLRENPGISWSVGIREYGEVRHQGDRAGVPYITHLSGHIMSTGFSKEVNEMVKRLSAEYGLPSIDRMDSGKEYEFKYIGYDGPKATAQEKIASFIKALEKTEPGKTYVFIDHPAYNDSEMETVMHVGYEDVAVDRQGVTDLLKSPEVAEAIKAKSIKLIAFKTLFEGVLHN
jgi:hypothetical protein